MNQKMIQLISTLKSQAAAFSRKALSWSLLTLIISATIYATLFLMANTAFGYPAIGSFALLEAALEVWGMGMLVIATISLAAWLYQRYRKKSLFMLIPAFIFAVPYACSICFHNDAALIGRGEILKPSATGNLTLVLWNRSPRTPYANILVELRDPEARRRLYHGVMPYPDQYPEETGGDFDGHYREFHSFDLRPGTYDMIVHELKTKTASVQQVVVPPQGKWFVEITFDHNWLYAESPYPYFSFAQGREPRYIL